MNKDYQIVNGIYLVQGDHDLDLHNDYCFQGLEYSVIDRKVVLEWKRSNGDWVNKNSPQSVTLRFAGISEFRFTPRTSSRPFTEDDCINTIGYWVDEDWAEDMIIVEPNQTVEPHWLTSIDFMSGAVLSLQADSAKALIQP